MQCEVKNKLYTTVLSEQSILKATINTITKEYTYRFVFVNDFDRLHFKSESEIIRFLEHYQA